MNTLLPVLAFSTADAPQAERLLDLIAAMRGRKPEGTILLVAAPDTHAESHKRIQIAAKVAFELVAFLPIGWPENAPKSKEAGTNWIFREAARFIGTNYRTPFLWLEPDSIPLRPSWLAEISTAYDRQIKRCMGAWLGNPAGSKFMDRVGVYPADYHQDINSADLDGGPLNFQAGETLIRKASKSKLFQVLTIDALTADEKIREDAAVIHGDKQGILLSRLIENPPASASLELEVLLNAPPETPSKVVAKLMAARSK